MARVDMNFTSGEPGLQLMPLVFDGKVCSGPLKLAQRALTLLFMPKSQSPDGMLGTDVAQVLTSGANNTGALQGYFLIAGARVLQSLQAYSNPADPLDEQIADLKVAAVTGVDPSQLSVTLIVTTKAGTPVTVTVPYELTTT